MTHRGDRVAGRAQTCAAVLGLRPIAAIAEPIMSTPPVVNSVTAPSASQIALDLAAAIIASGRYPIEAARPDMAAQDALTLYEILLQRLKERVARRHEAEAASIETAAAD